MDHDDIARAHRVGQSRNGKPKPMIVKFNRWKNKMTNLSNRKFRDDLANQGIKIVNDLTKKSSRNRCGSQEWTGKVPSSRKANLL